MLLSELTNGLVGVLNSFNKDPDIRRVVQDSREILAGDIFCCLKGESTDGHLYIHDAIEAGAVAILAEEEINEDVPTFTVENVRNILPKLSSRIVGNPSRDLKVVGVTGTNGKTSVVNLLSEILDKSGISTAVIGTLTGTLTTPEAPELQRILRSFLETGVEVVCMEVSSHSLIQKRVHETFFSSVAFTNLTHDHLDFHNTMKEYFAPGTAIQIIGNTLSGLRSVLTNTFLIILTVLFLLMETSGIPGKIKKAFPNSEDVFKSIKSFFDGFNRYLAIKTATSVCTGLFIFLWLYFAGIDFPILWGLLAFMLNFVPNVGSILAAITAVGTILMPKMIEACYP